MAGINRREFLGAGGAALVPGLSSLHAPTLEKKPNVLFVIADEWRYQSTTFGGDTNVHMRTMDRFATESINFENAISGCCICSPARASLVTGQYPLTHGVYINDIPLAPRGPTFAEVFSAGGYDTGFIGKWHLFGSPDGKYGRRNAFVPPEYRLGFRYWKAAECTHDYNRSHYYENDDPTRKYWSGYDAEAQTSDACEFIRRHAIAGVPYLLVLSWGPPHYPLESAPERYQELFQHRDLVLRQNVPMDRRTDALRDLRGYYAHMAALDDCFKRLLDTLESTGSACDTIVVFMSDHGDMMYSQGLQYKTCPWDEAIRVPLLVRYPRRFGKRGRRVSIPINFPDILPTLLGMSGLKVPGIVQGTDYSSSLDSGSTNTQTSAFICLPVPVIEARTNGFAEYRGVRDERYTYVRSIKGPWLLYDNVSDPFQMNNLCGKRGVRALQEEMDAKLRRWLAILDDQFMSGTEYLRRDKLAHYVETQFPVGHIGSPWGDWASTFSNT